MNEALDGFGHYGTGATGRTNMLAGPYAEINANFTPETTDPRTGTISLRSTNTAQSFWRRVLPASGNKKFMGCAQKLTNLPSSDARYCVGQFRDGSNNPVVSFTLTTTGAIEIRSGDRNGTVLATGAAAAFGAGAYHHVECMAFINGASGAGECRIDGVVAVSATGINLGVANLAQIVAGTTGPNTHGIGNFFHADLRSGNDLGGVNNDFMGDRRVFTLFPDADGTPQAWTPLSGSAFSNINQAAPDGDTTYVSSSTPAQACRVSFQPVPAGVAAINGLAIAVSARKTDVGVGTLQVNAVSGVSTDTGDAHALTTTYAYPNLDLYDQDPALSGPWTPTTVNAMFGELLNAS